MIPVPNWNMSWKFYTVVSAWKFEGFTASRILKQKITPYPGKRILQVVCISQLCIFTSLSSVSTNTAHLFYTPPDVPTPTKATHEIIVTMLTAQYIWCHYRTVAKCLSVQQIFRSVYILRGFAGSQGFAVTSVAVMTVHILGVMHSHKGKNNTFV